MADLVLNALRRKLDATDDPDRRAALEDRIAGLEGEPEDEPEDDLTRLSKADLLDLADEYGVVVPSGATKADIIEALGDG